MMTSAAVGVAALVSTWAVLVAWSARKTILRHWYAAFELGVAYQIADKMVGADAETKA